jgi:hypothetical protein
MRGRTLAVLCLLLLVAALPAAGQKSKRKKAVPPPSAAGEYKPSTDQVTVVRGDTLWDISTRVTGSPWHWPRIWAYNPELTNPHWIYPGDIVRFQPSELPLPKLAQLASSQREMPGQETPPPGTPEPTKDESASEGSPAVQEVRGGALPPEHARRVRRIVNLFISKNELAESGTLTNAVADKLMLATQDEVFITFPGSKRPSSGQRYMVYRTMEEVRHPITHEKYGYLTQVTGFASLRASDGDVSRAVLTDALSEVERGQYVAPLAQLPYADQRPTNARVPLSGVVLALEPGPSIVGERQILFVDIGAGKGLEPGNKLAVYIDEDPVVPGHKVPLTPVAVLMAVDVRDQATTCVVIDARQELRAGMIVKTIMH